MKYLKYPLKWIEGLADRIFAVLGAALFSQMPAFVKHYEQRLGGHVDEAARNVSAWQAMADKIANGCLDMLVSMGQASSEVFSLEASRKCAEDLARHETLLQALESIQNAPAWARGIVLLRHADVQIARATARAFTPNLPMDAEGLVYALFGVIFGLALFMLVKKTCMSCGKAVYRCCRRGLLSKDTEDEHEG